MYSPPKKAAKYSDFAPSTSSFSEEAAKRSRKINLDELDSISRNSCLSFYQDQWPTQSISSRNSISSSCSVFRVNISDSFSNSQSSSRKSKSNPYGYNRSEIYKYPNLVKLNLDFYFTKLKSNRSKYKGDDKFQNVFAEFELNKDFIESHFSSEEEIQKFYAKKLDELQNLQEEEIQKFIKKWEKDQVNATVEDFQDFCFLQGTKLILRDCGNETLSERPSPPEEKVNLRKANEKNEKLFELMSLRHERETKLLVLDFQDQLRKFRERCVDSVVGSKCHIVFDETSQISHFSNGTGVSGISNIKKMKKHEFNDDEPIKFEDSDDEELLRMIRSSSDSEEVNDNDIKILLETKNYKHSFSDKMSPPQSPETENKTKNFENKSDIEIEFEFEIEGSNPTSRAPSTPPPTQSKAFDMISQSSRSRAQKEKKRPYRSSKRSPDYRPRFNNFV